MKRFLSKPFTWGGYLKLTALCYAFTAVWYVWWLEATEIFSTIGWLKEQFCKIKKFFIR